MKLRAPAPAALAPWILLVCSLALVFARLRSPEAIVPLWRPWAEVGVLAFGMTAVILTGGIDLSVGSIVSLCGVVIGTLSSRAGLPIAWAATLGAGVGLVAGAINGALVVSGIAPLAATLATMALYSGLASALARGERVADFPEAFANLGQGDWFGVPTQLTLLAFGFLTLLILVHFTRFGRRLYAIGDNRTAAEFAAVPVRSTEWGLYALNGLIAGIVAVWFTARRGASVSDAGAGLELQAIACVVLGGTRVAGGFGSIGRTLLGLAVLTHLEIGLRLWGNLALPWTLLGRTVRLDSNARLIVIGLLLVLVAIVNERMSNNRRVVT